MQHRSPGEAVGGELRPLLVVEVEGVESLDDGAAIRHARGAARPLVRHPARQHPTRQPRVVHARHVAESAELPPRHVEVGRVSSPSLRVRSSSVEMWCSVFDVVEAL